MSKTRLDEGTIRRFAQLANIPALGTISEMSYARDDEALPGAEEDVMADPMADEAPPEEPVEDEAPAEPGDVDVLGLVNAIADAITAETGVEVTASEEVEGEEAPEEELPAPEEELPAEEPAPEEEAPLAEAERDLAAANVELDTTGDLVNEITRRVARRLLRDSASKK